MTLYLLVLHYKDYCASTLRLFCGGCCIPSPRVILAYRLSAPAPAPAPVVPHQKGKPQRRQTGRFFDCLLPARHPFLSVPTSQGGSTRSAPPVAVCTCRGFSKLEGCCGVSGGAASILPRCDREDTSTFIPLQLLTSRSTAEESPWRVAMDNKPPAKPGVAFSNLNVFGLSSTDEYQRTAASYLLAIPKSTARLFRRRESTRAHILHDFYGAVYPGEMLLVLGRPGSGCSTFLKTLAGEMPGLHVSPSSTAVYNGELWRISSRQFVTNSWL